MKAPILSSEEYEQSLSAAGGKREILLAYLPAATASFLTVLTLILYSVLMEAHYWTVYCSLAVMTVVPFAVVFVNRRWALGVPQYLIVLMCLHAVVSVDMGTAFGFYSRFSWWDSSVHCFFGFLCCATLYYLYFRLKNEPPKFLDFLVMVLLVIAFAAIWEVYEFVAGEIIHCDMQDVGILLAQGMNPLTDTMADIVVATVGGVVFEVLLLIKKQIVKAREKKSLAQN